MLILVRPPHAVWSVDMAFDRSCLVWGDDKKTLCPSAQINRAFTSATWPLKCNTVSALADLRYAVVWQCPDVMDH